MHLFETRRRKTTASATLLKIVGQTLTSSDTAYTVVGVLPANFQFAPQGSAEVWVPWQVSGSMARRRFMHWIQVIARLKPGVTEALAQAGMQPIAQRIAQEHNESHAGVSVLFGLAPALQTAKPDT